MPESENSRNASVLDGAQVETVECYLRGWLAGKQSLRPSTRLAYQIHLDRYLVPHLGPLPLTGLRARHIEQMYRDIAGSDQGDGRPLSVATLRRIHATLTSALNTAVRRGELDRNPAATVELPPAARSRATAWSADELHRFLMLTQDDRLHLLYLLLGLVGLRRGEAVALRWCDLDLNQGLLCVERSAVQVRGVAVVGPPKSSAGARTVVLDDETCRRLQWHACRQRLEHSPDHRRDSHTGACVHRARRHPAGSSPRVPTLRPVDHPVRPAPDPTARPSTHLGIARAGQRRVPARGEPPARALLDHRHRRHLLPRLAAGGQGVRRTPRPTRVPQRPLVAPAPRPSRAPDRHHGTGAS